MKPRDQLDRGREFSNGSGHCGTHDESIGLHFPAIDESVKQGVDAGV